MRWFSHKEAEPDDTEADRSLFLHPSPPPYPSPTITKLGAPKPLHHGLRFFLDFEGKRESDYEIKAGIDLKHQLPNAHLVIVHIQMSPC